MFSETVNLVSDIEETQSWIINNADQIETRLNGNIRRAIFGLIRSKGEEEYYKESNPVGRVLTMVSEAWTLIQNQLIDDKIKYAQDIFLMIPEDNASIFFLDLRNGLDYIIQRWDASEAKPATVWFRSKPQRVKTRRVLKRIKNDESI